MAGLGASLRSEEVDYIIELLTGPGNLRFVVQPLIAIVLAIRDGRNDAKAGTPPYLYELVFGSGRRAATLKGGLRAILMPFGAAVILDSILAKGSKMGHRGGGIGVALVDMTAAVVFAQKDQRLRILLAPLY